MSETQSNVDADLGSQVNRSWLFWTCFIALIATAFGFMSRVMMIGEWGVEFGLTETQKGEILGAALWPFGISIFLFSLTIDKIGYGKTLAFAFVCHAGSCVITILATGYDGLYWGTFLMALGNGTVEAVINPAVATIYRHDKSKWLNILHAAWPGGLVISGMMSLALNPSGLVGGFSSAPIGSQWKVALLLIPTLVYGLMMIRCRFPVQERVQAGVSYRAMLQEIGIAGALIIIFLMVGEISRYFELTQAWRYGIGGVLLVGFGLYVRSVGQWLFVALMLIMIVSGTTEVSTDQWIKDLMQPEVEKLWGLGLDGGWVLVYTATIMMLLRFCAGPLVRRFNPLGVLAISSAIAIVGLIFMSNATGSIILLAATIYGAGQAFFWPMMLGVVADRFPRGGAMTLNTVAAAGVLGIGVLGSPGLGYIQDTRASRDIKAADPALHQQLIGDEPKTSIYGSYEAVDRLKVDALDAGDRQVVTEIQVNAKKSTLFTAAVLPAFLLICYLSLIVYFRMRGGYRPVDIAPDRTG
jgi:MFS family permease